MSLVLLELFPVSVVVTIPLSFQPSVQGLYCSWLIWAFVVLRQKQMTHMLVCNGIAENGVQQSCPWSLAVLEPYRPTAGCTVAELARKGHCGFACCLLDRFSTSDGDSS